MPKSKLDHLAYKRDGYKCTDCGNKHRIGAHHIIPGIEKLDNLITLCPKCHTKAHNWIGCFKAKLLPINVLAIQHQLKAGKSERKVAKMFNISRGAIRGIKWKQSWKHILCP